MLHELDSTRHKESRPPCPRCGQAIVRVPETLLSKLLDMWRRLNTDGMQSGTVFEVWLDCEMQLHLDSLNSEWRSSGYGGPLAGVSCSGDVYVDLVTLATEEGRSLEEIVAAVCARILTHPSPDESHIASTDLIPEDELRELLDDGDAQKWC